MSVREDTLAVASANAFEEKPQKTLSIVERRVPFGGLVIVGKYVSAVSYLPG